MQTLTLAGTTGGGTAGMSSLLALAKSTETTIHAGLMEVDLQFHPLRVPQPLAFVLRRAGVPLTTTGELPLARMVATWVNHNASGAPPWNGQAQVATYSDSARNVTVRWQTDATWASVLLGGLVALTLYRLLSFFLVVLGIAVGPLVAALAGEEAAATVTGVGAVVAAIIAGVAGVAVALAPHILLSAFLLAGKVLWAVVQAVAKAVGGGLGGLGISPAVLLLAAAAAGLVVVGVEDL